MKKIVVIFNGGTISMKVDERIKAAVPSLSGEEIMAMVAGIDQYANIESYSFSSMPSPHMKIETMLKLSQYVEKIIKREDVDGVVITHGTDTLEETAYFLDLTIDTYKPIVVTGAMRSSSELGYDGPFNLAASIATAIADDSKNRGVLVCFNGELNLASEVTKANSMALRAFLTPNFGPIGIVDNNRVIYYRKIKRAVKFNVEKIQEDVALIKVVAGMNGDMIDFLVSKRYKGIVIEGLGRGNVPPEMIPAIKNALKNGVKIVLVSRCYEGRVFESYGYEGGGKQLKDLGVIFGETLPGQKARIKLLLALNDIKNLKIENCFLGNENNC